MVVILLLLVVLFFETNWQKLWASYKHHTFLGKCLGLDRDNLRHYFNTASYILDSIELSYLIDLGLENLIKFYNFSYFKWCWFTYKQILFYLVILTSTTFILQSINQLIKHEWDSSYPNQGKELLTESKQTKRL